MYGSNRDGGRSSLASGKTALLGCRVRTPAKNWQLEMQSRFKMSLWLNLAKHRVEEEQGRNFVGDTVSTAAEKHKAAEKSSSRSTHLAGGLEGGCHGYLSSV